MKRFENEFNEYMKWMNEDIEKTYKVDLSKPPPEKVINPIVTYKSFEKDGKIYFMDEFDNIYDEHFVYLEKNEESRKRKNKDKPKDKKNIKKKK